MASFTGCDTLRLQLQYGALREGVGAVDRVRSPTRRTGLGGCDEAVRERPNRIRQHSTRHYRRVRSCLASEAGLRHRVGTRRRQRHRDSGLVHPRVRAAAEAVAGVLTLLHRQGHGKVTSSHGQNTARKVVLLENRPSVASAIRLSIAVPRFRMAFRRASPSS